MKQLIKMIPLILFCLLGFFYRLGFASLAEKEPIWDMQVYQTMAQDMLAGKVVASCCFKTVGYSAFLAVIYRIFGSDNLAVIQIIQAFIDTMTAIVVYLTAKRLFSEPAPIASFLLYLTNPLTSSHVGLRLPEATTIFMLAFAVFLSVQASFKTKISYWLAVGWLFGLLLFFRMQNLFNTLITIFLYGLLVIGRRKLIKYLLISLTGFIIGSSYTLIANWHEYKLVSIKPPYQPIYSSLYANFYKGDRYPELDVDLSRTSPEYQQINFEVFQIALDKRPLYESIMKAKWLEKMKTDWPLFLRNSVLNLVFIWDKDHLSTYRDVFYPSDRQLVRIYNFFMLFLSGFGLIGFAKDKRWPAAANPVFLATVSFIFINSFSFALISNETRHTLPMYSLIFLWAGYGIQVVKGIRLKFNRRP
jgi:4-amino-4-deoxy-L-arabinose transferase-like glycosyltransferase